MKKQILIFLMITILSLLFLVTGCDFFKKAKDESTIDIYVESIKLPENLVKESQKAFIKVFIESINFLGKSLDINKEYRLPSSSMLPICRFKIPNGTYQSDITVSFSPKATVDVYDGDLLIDTNSLTLMATILNCSPKRYNSYSLESLETLDIGNDEYFYILLDFSKASDIYSDNSFATPNIHFARAEDLITVSGTVWNSSEYRIEFSSSYYEFNTFTNSRNYSIKLYKGNYTVLTSLYEFDATFPSTSVLINPFEDIVKDFFPE